MNRKGRVWTKIVINKPVTKKPLEVRMGKGKGAPSFWICRIKPGQILFEIFFKKSSTYFKNLKDRDVYVTCVEIIDMRHRGSASI